MKRVSDHLSFAGRHHNEFGDYSKYEKQFGIEEPHEAEYEKGESINIIFPHNKTSQWYTAEEVEGEARGERGKLLTVKDHWTKKVIEVECDAEQNYSMKVHGILEKIEIRSSKVKAKTQWFTEVFVDRGGGFGEIAGLFTGWLRFLIPIYTILKLVLNTSTILEKFSWSRLVKSFEDDSEDSLSGFSIIGLFPKLRCLVSGGREDDVIALIEYGCIVILWASLVLTLLNALCVKLCSALRADTEREQKRKDEALFYGMVVVIFGKISHLISFSSLNILHYLNTAVLQNDVKELRASYPDAKDPDAGCKRISFFVHAVWLFFSRLVFFIMGHDAFMAKLRVFMVDVGPGVEPYVALKASFVFTQQVLGIVQWRSLVQGRVLSFIFAGENCRYERDEIVNKAVWRATLVKHIFAYEMPIPDFLALIKWPLQRVASLFVMLSLSDEDMQRLVLNEYPWHQAKPPTEEDSQGDEKPHAD